MLAFGTQVRGFKPGRSRRIFRAKKFLGTPSFGGEVKPLVPCRSFRTCKRSLNVTCRLAFRQNYRTFLAHNSTFRSWVLIGDITQRDSLQTFREKLSVSFSRVKKSKKKTLEDGTGRLSRNVGNELPLYAA